MESVLVDKEYQKYCAFCGRPCETEHHLVFGRGLRKLSEEDGLKLTVCYSCHVSGHNGERVHNSPMAEKMSKMLGQMAYEKERALEGMGREAARESFRKRYGRSYL